MLATVACYVLFVVDCLLVVCRLSRGGLSLFVAHCALFAGCCVLFVVVGCSVFVGVCCLVVCRSLLIVCC